MLFAVQSGIDFVESGNKVSFTISLIHEFMIIFIVSFMELLGCDNYLCIMHYFNYVPIINYVNSFQFSIPIQRVGSLQAHANKIF